jgi:diguanylate cyclase (GGDEF)-like protein
VAQPVDVRERVRADVVGLLYRQVPQSSVISVAVASLLAWILWDVSQRSLLQAWWAIVVALAVLRMGLYGAFKRYANDSRARLWEQRFLHTLIVTGAVWGVGGVVLMPKDSLAHQILIYAFLMGMVGGAIANYSAHVVGVTVTTVFVMLPATIAFALQPSLLLRVLAFASAIYIVAAFRAAKTMSTALHRSYQLTHELEAARADAERQARTDELTQMRNRRAFYELGELALAQAVRYRDPLSLILLDIDRFKQINDEWGHAKGDEVLRTVAVIIQRTVRTSDVAGRVGGEEFATLLPRASLDDAFAMAERLRAAMERTPLENRGGELRFTASFGVAALDGEANTLDRLLAEADKALYEAKQAGRNRVVCKRPEPQRKVG